MFRGLPLIPPSLARCDGPNGDGHKYKHKYNHDNEPRSSHPAVETDKTSGAWRSSLQGSRAGAASPDDPGRLGR